MDKIFNYYVLDSFCKKYNINKHVAISNNNYYFRFLCFKLNYFIKYALLPKFPKHSLYEAVFIEFRNFPHIEFLIRNAILKLGTKWSHTIICGNLNYQLVKNICRSISSNVNIIRINVNNMTQTEYSKFLTTPDFWNLLKGEKILIHQEDSIIFKTNVHLFLEYDFVGAPFLKTTNDTPNCVGNGGLSLRSKSKMLEVIDKFRPTDYEYNSSTMEYMRFVDLQFPPEDVYFSKCMQEQFIGNVANWDSAYNFSYETVFNENSFGGHKIWISNSQWKIHIKKIFNFKLYKPRSNLNRVLLFNKQPLSLDLNDNHKNAFDVDLYFFCKVNNIEYTNDINAINYVIKIALDGFIYHPKQLLNMYPDLLFYTFLDNIYVIDYDIRENVMRADDEGYAGDVDEDGDAGRDGNEQHNIIKPLYQFVNENLYNSTFSILSNLLLRKKYSSLNDNYDILLLVFIGDEQIGVDLIQRIIQYKSLQSDFNVAFCFNSSKINNFDTFKKLIKNNFDFYAIYKSKEMGSDITPTLLMYDDIVKTHHFNHVFKFHTKSVNHIYANLTNYLLSVPLVDLLHQNESQLSGSNCIGHPNYYINLQVDHFNSTLKQKYMSKIDINKHFIGGTIFYTSSIVFDAVLNFVKNNNYRSFLLNNLYENNSINSAASPIHFLERLFGGINT
jgi:hypothetical protein